MTYKCSNMFSSGLMFLSSYKSIKVFFKTWLFVLKIKGGKE